MENIGIPPVVAIEMWTLMKKSGYHELLSREKDNSLSFFVSWTWKKKQFQLFSVHVELIFRNLFFFLWFCVFLLLSNQ